MKIIKSVNKLSYKSILSMGFLLALTFSIPTTLLLVNQQTRLSSSAKIDKPLVIPRARENYGNPARAQIEVSRVYPFLGKSEDELVILGRNFGDNPADRELVVGDSVVGANDIDTWQDDMISVFVPVGAQSGQIQIRSGSFSWTSKYPFIVYDGKTQTQVRRNGNNIIISSPASIKRLTYSIVGGAVGESGVMIDTNGNFALTIPSGEINHLALYDAANELVPFLVDPTEFGF